MWPPQALGHAALAAAILWGGRYGAIRAAGRWGRGSLGARVVPMRVNAVTPGLIDTPRFHTADEADRDTIVNNRSVILLRKRVGSAAGEVAQVMLMTNAYKTREVVPVDGGGCFV